MMPCICPQCLTPQQGFALAKKPGELAPPMGGAIRDEGIEVMDLEGERSSSSGGGSSGGAAGDGTEEEDGAVVEEARWWCEEEGPGYWGGGHDAPVCFEEAGDSGDVHVAKRTPLRLLLESTALSRSWEASPRVD
ncbi:MAG: hypothetical protein LQ346_009082, partial [Caloplaca aetnensis]